MPLLARALVLFSWITCFATAEKQDSLTVPTVESATITVPTTKMPVSDVNVRFIIFSYALTKAVKYGFRIFFEILKLLSLVNIIKLVLIFSFQNSWLYAWCNQTGRVYFLTRSCRGLPKQHMGYSV